MSGKHVTDDLDVALVPEPTNILPSLNDPEETRFLAYERIIESGQRAFMDVGWALLEIRDQRLYQASYASFEAYCKERWGFTRQHGHRLTEAARVMGHLSPIGDESPAFEAPANEAQARELVPLLSQPEVMAETWRETVAVTNGRPTALAVRRQVERRLEQPDAANGKPPLAAATNNMELRFLRVLQGGRQLFEHMAVRELAKDILRTATLDDRQRYIDEGERLALDLAIFVAALRATNLAVVPVVAAMPPAPPRLRSVGGFAALDGK